MAELSRGTFRFGIFELDALTGELRKSGKRVLRLQAQPLQILLLLLENAGAVVSREEIRQKIWPADTFVDFDHGLNTAINKLRGALGDSAANSAYIETLPRIGYRFIARVEAAQMNLSGAATAEKQAPAAELAAPATADSAARKNKILSDAQELPAASRRLTHLLFALIQIMYLGFYIAALTNLSRTQQGIGQLTFHVFPVFVLLILTAAAGIPVRLYLISAAAFQYAGLARKFRRIFAGVFVLDEIWALAPLLLVQYIGLGLALCAVAALLYLPFAERSLLLMGSRAKMSAESGRA